MVNLSQTTEATVELEIEPVLKASIRKNLRLYASLKGQLDAAKEAVDAQLAHLEMLREQTGAKSVWLDGYGRITQVDGGTSSSLNWKKLFALGVTPAMKALATVTKPKRGHTLVTLPGEREEQ